MSDKPAFILFTCHTPHFTPKVLENLVYTVWGEKLETNSGEMTVPQKVPEELSQVVSTTE